MKTNLGKFKIDVSENNDPVFVYRTLWCVGTGLYIKYKGDELTVTKKNNGYRVVY